MSTTTTPQKAHIYFLLDASGSMGSLRSDVIGGFNAFCDDQRRDGAETLMTFVQFDSEDPHLVITDAKDLREIAPLTGDDYRPRGGTPLYDAMGQLITDATIRSEELKGAEAVLFVVFTDGEENQSREYDRDKIFELVKRREAQGWTFVYLGANQDSYAAGGRVGFDDRSVQNFAASSDGVARAFGSLSKGMMKERGKMMRGEMRVAADFFEGDKEAEAHLRGEQ